MTTRSNGSPVKSLREKPALSPVESDSDLSKLRTPGDGHMMDVRYVRLPWEQRRDIGKALRERAPRENHANKYSGSPKRPDPLDLLASSNQGRQKEFIPLRMGRMAASPFAFLRGSAGVMAWDLSKTMTSGIRVIIDGDAHINNFGLYGTPQRDVIIDLNDFDEATIGPWEWDLKRLVASINVAARENGMNKVERAEAVMRAVEGYRWNLARMEKMGVLDVWYTHAYPDTKNPLLKRDPKAQAVIEKTVAKARSQTNATLLKKTAERSAAGGCSKTHPF